MEIDFTKIARDVLEIEAQTLTDSAKRVDDNITKAVKMILKCSGKLIITGVGKSGLVGAKMAATFASTGTPSFFIHPTEALHGDLGMIDKNDVLLAISYSGESQELSLILPHIERFKIPLISFTGSKTSTLGEFSDICIETKVAKEACPLGIAPTSSTTLSLAMGDALAVCLMRARGFKKEDFASLHPGGSLGRQLFIKVSDVMRKKDLPIIETTTSLAQAIVVMSRGRIGAVLISDKDGALCAILTDGDLRRALMRSDFDINNRAFMYATQEPKTVEDKEMLASDALLLMERAKIQILIVKNRDGSVAGALHLHDLIEKGIGA